MPRRHSHEIPGVDSRELAKEASRRMAPATRRAFLAGAGGLGTLTLLTGLKVVDGESAERLLKRISAMNDHIQAALFDPTRLARSFSEADIERPFPFNAFYPEADAPEIAEADWSLAVGGRVADRRAWTLRDLRALPQETQITEHVCIEGWSAVGKWTGVRLSLFLERVGADLGAKYVGFLCDDRYSTSLDMATALHPQTQMTLSMDGGVLPRRHGYPLKIRVPTKLGFKNPKHVVELFVANDFPGGFWENQGYNWFSGL